MNSINQNKSGRLVVIINPFKDERPWIKPWGIEAVYQVKNWVGDAAIKYQTTFTVGTVGLDIAGPFLLPEMTESSVYPKPFIHKVMIGANTYYIHEDFLECAYSYYEHNKTF